MPMPLLACATRERLMTTRLRHVAADGAFFDPFNDTRNAALQRIPQDGDAPLQL